MNEQNKKCEHCNDEIENIKHFVLKCDKYSNLRMDLMQTIELYMIDHGFKIDDNFTEDDWLDLMIFGLFNWKENKLILYDPDNDDGEINDHHIFLLDSFCDYVMSTKRFKFWNR